MTFSKAAFHSDISVLGLYCGACRLTWAIVKVIRYTADFPAIEPLLYKWPIDSISKKMGDIEKKKSQAKFFLNRFGEMNPLLHFTSQHCIQLSLQWNGFYITIENT